MLRVNADQGRNDHTLTDHMKKLRNFTKGVIREFSALPLSLQLKLSNLIVCLMISQTNTQKLHKRASMVVDIKPVFTQNESEKQNNRI